MLMRSRRPGSMPFGYKLMLTYCLSIMIPVLLIGYIADSIYTHSIKEQTETNIAGTMKQMRDNIEYRIEHIQRVSDLIYYDYTIIKHLRTYVSGFTTYEAMTKYMLPKLQSTVESTMQSIWLSMFLKNKAFPEIYKNYMTDPLSQGTNNIDIYHMDRIEDKLWYRTYPEEVYGETLQWTQVEDDVEYGRISVLRRMVDAWDPRNLEEVGFIRISLYMHELLGSVDYQMIGEGTHIFVLDAMEKPIHSSGSVTMLPDASSLLHDSYDRFMVMKEVIPSVDWQIVALIPTARFVEQTKKVRLLTIMICAVFLIVFVIAGAMMSNYFAKKVKKITTVLDSFQEGAFHKRLNLKGNDEFTRISQAINNMGHEIGDLIRKVYIKDIERKEAELETLQTQINPHFLYNTLSSINRLAQFGHTEKLRRMVLDLAKFYRLSLSDGRTIIPIASELEHAATYLAIQKIKYEDRIHATIEMEPGIEPYATIKLSLQPFIENIIEHAWCGDQVHIRIVAEKHKECIRFKVIDNGVGMRQDHIQTGYGIRNVDQRIKLYFGDDYGVRIHSGIGIGTAVVITIPAHVYDEDDGEK